MSLHIEYLCDDLKAYLLANLRTQIDAALAEQPNTIPVSVPRPENFFVGERNQFVPYVAPACFIMPSTSKDVTGSMEGENLLKFEHALFLSFLLEGTDVQQLNRATYRLTQAAAQCLRDQDITPIGITTRSTVVRIPLIDYGRMFVAQAQRMFRRESWLTLRLDHWDLRTPMNGPSLVQITTASQIVANTSESLLSTTGPTTVVTATPSATGNFMVHIYYRVVTASTNLTLTLTWNDGGAQVSEIAVGRQTVGSYTVRPIFLVGASGAAITLTATAGTANQVYVSASVEAL